MTLGFMQHWPKEMAMQDNKTYFIEKINLGLWQQGLIKRIDYIDELEEFRSKFGDNWDWKPKLHPKFHTIRNEESNRWKPGMDIHFVINGRSKNRFQFAPVVKCVRVQTIEIKHAFPHRYIFVDGRFLNSWKEMNRLAMNDGFESVEDFFKYFNQDFKGKLIHWTGLKY